jgi:ATP-dependent Clp protease ATP-binding subunit ClpA
MDTLNAESEKVVALARQEAAGLHHEFTGTEHILLGGDDDIAAPLLGKHGIVALEVRAQVARPGSDVDESSERTQPLTARAKQVLTLAGREAEALDDEEVGPEHLLLGIIRQGSGVAALVLSDMGVDLSELREEILAARTGRDRLFDQARYDSDYGRTAEIGGGDGEVSETAPAREVAPPLCPSCGQRLADVVALATVTPDGSGAPSRRRGASVTLIFCGACGHTISASR